MNLGGNHGEFPCLVTLVILSLYSRLRAVDLESLLCAASLSDITKHETFIFVAIASLNVHADDFSRKDLNLHQNLFCYTLWPVAFESI